MFENVKTVCTPWKTKYIGCSGCGNSQYTYSPKVLRCWRMQQGAPFKQMQSLNKVKYLIAKTLLPLYNILTDKGISVTSTMKQEWIAEWKKYNL
jgi:hypothetical protein